MKSLGCRIAILTLALLLATGAFAASTAHKGTFTISGPVQVTGKQLPAGEYEIKWDGAGPDVQASITHSGKVVATVPATVVELQQKSTSTRADVSGDRTLSKVQFSGQKYALEFSGASGGSSAGGNSIR